MRVCVCMCVYVKAAGLKQGKPTRPDVFFKCECLSESRIQFPPPISRISTSGFGSNVFSFSGESDYCLFPAMLWIKLLSVCFIIIAKHNQTSIGKKRGVMIVCDSIGLMHLHGNAHIVTMKKYL